jgi:hypothetical protein
MFWRQILHTESISLNTFIKTIICNIFVLFEGASRRGTSFARNHSPRGKRNPQSTVLCALRSEATASVVAPRSIGRCDEAACRPGAGAGSTFGAARGHKTSNATCSHASRAYARPVASAQQLGGRCGHGAIVAAAARGQHGPFAGPPRNFGDSGCYAAVAAALRERPHHLQTVFVDAAHAWILVEHIASMHDSAAQGA